VVPRTSGPAEKAEPNMAVSGALMASFNKTRNRGPRTNHTTSRGHTAKCLETGVSAPRLTDLGRRKACLDIIEVWMPAVACAARLEQKRATLVTDRVNPSGQQGGAQYDFFQYRSTS
jgi:hypothetical protein